MNERIRLFICDDHALYRQGLIAMLESEPAIEVVGEAGSGREAIEQLKTIHPHVVLMDISMPEMSGLEATRRIVQSAKDPKVLILTMFDEDGLLVRCLEAGASGYILKDAPSARMVGAVKQAFSGSKDLSPVIPNEGVHEDMLVAQQIQSPDQLSSLEREILRLLVEGSSVRDIAFSFRLKVETIEVLQHNLMRKTNSHSRDELVDYAINREIASASPADLRNRHAGKRAA